MAEYQEKFIVVNGKHLTLQQIGELLTLLETFKLPNNKYYVCNQDEPYAPRIIKTILDGEDQKANSGAGVNYKENAGSEFAKYKRTNIAEMRYYIKGESLENISVSKEDNPEIDLGMVARNPNNHKDQRYVARKYFEENFEAI
jgi:hypothetical protein